jgi:hypothetical protein
MRHCHRPTESPTASRVTHLPAFAVTSRSFRSADSGASAGLEGRQEVRLLGAPAKGRTLRADLRVRASLGLAILAATFLDPSRSRPVEDLRDQRERASSRGPAPRATSRRGAPMRRRIATGDFPSFDCKPKRSSARLSRLRPLPRGTRRRARKRSPPSWPGADARPRLERRRRPGTRGPAPAPRQTGIVRHERDRARGSILFAGGVAVARRTCSECARGARAQASRHRASSSRRRSRVRQGLRWWRHRALHDPLSDYQRVPGFHGLSSANLGGIARARRQPRRIMPAGCKGSWSNPGLFGNRLVKDAKSALIEWSRVGVPRPSPA